jgi:hypothetical protein
MDIRRTLNIKQFLVPNRIWIHLWVILCLALCSSCHKEDPGAYKLTADSFTNAVLSEQYYQQLLDTELSLVEMAIESDQQLIGLHVKATTSQGLKDPVLREWAKQKLPLLTENLAGIQLLK